MNQPPIFKLHITEHVEAHILILKNHRLWIQSSVNTVDIDIISRIHRLIEFLNHALREYSKHIFNIRYIHVGRYSTQFSYELPYVSIGYSAISLLFLPFTS